VYNSIALVSSSASFMLDNSMFVVEGDEFSGYVYSPEVFFMLGLTIMKDFCFVGQSNPVEGLFRPSKAGTRPFQMLNHGDTDGDC
jgi:hypothetical protein